MRYTKKEKSFFTKNGFEKDGAGEYNYSLGVVVKGDHAMDIADLRLYRVPFKKRIGYYSSLFHDCFIDCLINGQIEKELRKDYQSFLDELNKKSGTHFKMYIKKGAPIIYEPNDFHNVNFKELCDRFEKFIVLMDGWVRSIFWKAVEEGHYNFNFKEKQSMTYEEAKKLTIWD